MFFIFLYEVLPENKERSTNGINKKFLYINFLFNTYKTAH